MATKKIAGLTLIQFCALAGLDACQTQAGADAMIEGLHPRTRAALISGGLIDESGSVTAYARWVVLEAACEVVGEGAAW